MTMATIEESIINSITKNGFPEKKVSLPFQAIFKACKNSDVSLSAVLKNLEKQQIYNEKSGDKILFFDQQTPKKTPDFDPGEIPEGLYKEAMDKVKNMDPTELEEMKKRIMSMSSTEQQDMLKKAKDLFKQKK